MGVVLYYTTWQCQMILYFLKCLEYGMGSVQCRLSYIKTIVFNNGVLYFKKILNFKTTKDHSQHVSYWRSVTGNLNLLCLWHDKCKNDGALVVLLGRSYHCHYYHDRTAFHFEFWQRQPIHFLPITLIWQVNLPQSPVLPEVFVEVFAQGMSILPLCCLYDHWNNTASFPVWVTASLWERSNPPLIQRKRFLPSKLFVFEA